MIIELSMQLNNVMKLHTESNNIKISIKYW